MVHVLAVLGDSPAGLTQLLWHLALVRGVAVRSAEIWITDRHLSRSGLTGLFHEGGRFFEQLERAAGERVPVWDLAPRVDRPAAERPTGGYTIFTGSDADFASDLSVRLPVLRALDIPLIAGLAGGGQRRAAVLFKAFELYARQTDELVEVRLDRRVIAAGTDPARFPCPTAGIAKVPPAQQVRVEPIPFLARADQVERDPQRRAFSLLAYERATHAAPARDPSARLLVQPAGRAFRLSLGPRHAVLGRESTWLLRQLVLAAPAPMTSGALAASVPGSREDFTVDRLLNTTRARLEEAAAGDAVWTTLVPRRRAGRRWWIDPSPALDLTALLGLAPRSDGSFSEVEAPIRDGARKQ